MRLTVPQLVLLKESDLERRKTEREYIAGHGNEAKQLKNQLRAGVLNPRNVAIAAALGYEPAKQLELEEPNLNKNNFRYLIGSALNSSELSREEVVSFAVDCAEQVLPVFEAEYPDDDRPRRAVMAARGFGDAAGVAGFRAAASNAAIAAAASDAEETADAAASYTASYADAAAIYAAWAVSAAAWAAIEVNAAWAAIEAVVDALMAGLSKDWVVNRLVGYLLNKY